MYNLEEEMKKEEEALKRDGIILKSYLAFTAVVTTFFLFVIFSGNC